MIDVRQRSEYEAGHVPGAVHVELGSLAHTDVPDGPVTVMCGHGERAMTGASILTARGHRDVAVLDGGPDTWAAVERPTPDRRPMSAPTTTPAPLRLGLRENLAQFSLLVGVNALVGGMIGQERTVLPLLAEDEFGLTKFTAALTFIAAFGIVKAGDQLLRRHPVGPLRPQTGARRRLDHRAPRPAAVDVGTDMGLGGVRQRPPRRQPRAHLVDDGDHEDRPRRPRQARLGDGAQRGRRLRRRRRHRPRHRLHRRTARAAPGAVLPRPRLRRPRPGHLRIVRARDPRSRPLRGRQPRHHQRRPPRPAHDPRRSSP